MTNRTIFEHLNDLNIAIDDLQDYLLKLDLAHILNDKQYKNVRSKFIQLIANKLKELDITKGNQIQSQN